MARMPEDVALGVLAQSGPERDSVVTSVRVPRTLREVARAMQRAGLIESWNDVLVQGARHRLEAIAHRAGLDAHYDEHPQLRPTAGEVALALAEMDGGDLAGRRDLVERAAEELLAVRADASGDDVLTYALALATHGPAA
jgi:hypothetical protein